MFTGIEHTAIATPDTEALARWYETKLGFTIVHRYNGNVFVRASDSTMLELIPSEGEALDAKIKTPGIRHLAIKADDIDEGVRELEAKGVEIFERVEMGSVRLAFFHDAGGNILHLIWREKAL